MAMSRSMTTGAAVSTVALLLSISAWGYDPASDPAKAASDAGHAQAMKKSCRPEYPDAALKAKVEGKTVVNLTISPLGDVSKVDVLESAGPTPEHKLLDLAASVALLNCPSKPGTDAAGRPIASSVKITYVWQMPAAAGANRNPQ